MPIIKPDLAYATPSALPHSQELHISGNVWKALDAIQLTVVREISLASVRTHESLQPRSTRLIPFKDLSRMDSLSEDHIQMLSLALESSADLNLEPIWLADVPTTPERGIEPGLYIVDGHHRFSAYRKAKRTEIPARVLPLSFAMAVLLTKPVNCSGCKLSMHREQRLDAAWQYLAIVMEGGARPLLPNGESLRTVAGKFGVGHNTVSRMLRELPKVNRDEFRPDARDPGTGWPRWKYVRMPKSMWQTPLEVLPEEARVAKEAEQLARTIADLMENSSHMARVLALRLLADERITSPDPEEAVNFLAEACRPYGTHVEYVLSHWNNKRAAQAPDVSQNSSAIGTPH
jgi:hypothetical protein